VAYLQFISGGRDQQLEELNPGASLVIGSGDQAHIRLMDAEVKDAHCQVYPGGGSFWLQDLSVGNTVMNMKRLKGTTEGLKDRDVFIVGTTFVKFWAEKPPAGGGASPQPPGAPSGAALEGLKRELAAAQAEAAKLGAATAQVADLQRQVAKLDELRREVESTKKELSQARGDADAAKREVESTKKELSQARGDATRLKGELERAQGERDELETKASELERAKGELEGRVERMQTEVESAKADAAAEAQRAKADAEAQVEKARAAAKKEQADLEAAVDATRAELEALRAKLELSGRDRLAALTDDGDLAKLVEALALPAATRRRLEAALEDAVTREALRRVAGPVVPLRGLRVPGCDRDLETELGAVKRRDEQVQAARAAGLHDLEASELERLLEVARR
jgi:DNA repair exonuclease SbcCD ATPase subunit